MRVAELVDKAAKSKGSALELAREMRKAPARLSEWKSGKRKPDAAEIAYLAKVAGLPVLITLAFVEKDLHPESAELWDAALGELKGPFPAIGAGPECALCKIAKRRKTAHRSGFFVPSCRWNTRQNQSLFVGGKQHERL